MDQIGDKSSGIDYAAMEQALADAEPLRLKALAATLNAVVGLCLTIVVMVQAASSSMVAWSLAVIPPMILLPVSMALWRSMAMSVMAPVAAAKWGQTDFVAGIAAVEWKDLLGLAGANRHGNAYAQWKSAGVYRDTHYRAREIRLTVKRERSMHFLTIEVRLEKSVGGIIEIASKAWGLGHLDNLFRALDGETQRKQLDPGFDAALDVFAPHHVDVTKVLTPELREALLTIYSQLQPRPFMARLDHGWLYMQLRIDGPSLSEASLWRPTRHYIDSAEQLWWELTVPHRMIDTIKGDHDGRLR